MVSISQPSLYNNESKDDLGGMACLPRSLMSFLENNYQHQHHSYPLSAWLSGFPPTARNNNMYIPSRAAIASATAIGGPGSGNTLPSKTNLHMSSSPDIFYEMQDFLKALVWANHDWLQWRPSQIEGPQLRGVFVRRDAFACGGGGCASTANASRFPYGESSSQPLPGLQSTGGELLNLHLGSGRSHMILSFADATTAVNQGWAEARLLPRGYVIVYTPRDEAELAEWKKLVMASAHFCIDAVRRPE